MKIRWTPAAVADLESINIYLRKMHPRFHQPTMLKLYDGVRSLRTLPNRGRIGREQGTRELLFLPMPYIAVYRVVGDAIEIVCFYHGRQDRA